MQAVNEIYLVWAAMKTKYLFLFTRGDIEESTLFVDVFVGTSQQDRRDLEFFRLLAERCNSYYFHIYDLETTEFVRRVNEYLQERSGDLQARCLRCSMSARKLRTLIKSGLYDEWAQTFFQATRGLRRMSLSSNSSYFCAVFRADHGPAMPPTL